METNQRLREFTRDEGFAQVLETAFGTDFNSEAVEVLREEWQTGNYWERLPIEVVPSHEIGNAFGAYATLNNTIYLSEEFLSEATLEEAVAVLLEEVGHSVDARLNEEDSPGDEGAIFSALVRGKALSAEEMAVLKTEDDRAIVTLDGEQISVEQADAQQVNVFNSNDLDNAIGQVQTIATNQTGAQHYNYFSSSGHPSGVPLGPQTSNIWVHENLNTGEFSFGFIFGKENNSFANSATFQFRIVGSETDVFVAQSDDPGEATEIAPGTFEGTFGYNNANTDGIMVSGLTGQDWTVIINSVDFGAVNTWNAASGDGNHLPLTLGEEFRITPGTDPSDSTVDNLPPTIDSSSTASVEENLTLATTVTATDPNADDLSFLISGGEDGDWFAIDPLSGELNFIDAPDFENPLDLDGNNVYQVQVTVDDGNEGTAKQDIEITVFGVEEAPTNVQLDDSNIDENSSNDALVGNLSAVDPEGDSFSFSLIDDAEGRFSLNDNRLEVADGSLLDFESNTSHDVVIEVTDTGGLSSQKTLAIAVNDINEPPSASNNTLTTEEDTDRAFAAADFNFSDVDSGDTLQEVRIETLPAEGILYLDANGNSLVDTDEAVAAGESISVSAINAGEFKFKPDPDENGAPYTDFTFSVSDGFAFSTPATMTLNVTPDLFLSGMTNFSTDSAGNFSGGQGWNTLTGDPPYDLWVIQEDNLNGLFVNSPGSNINLPLGEGETTFTLYGNSGVAQNFFGLNLFFNGNNESPGISVFAPMLTSSEAPGVPSINNSASTFGLGSTVPASGSATFTNGDQIVELTSYGWYDPSVFSQDRVQPYQPVPGSGPSIYALDFIGKFTLEVSNVASSIFIADAAAPTLAGGVLSIDPVTGDQTVITSAGNFVSPLGIAIDANGDLLVTDPNAFGTPGVGGPGGIVRVDAETGAQTVISSAGIFSGPIGIVIDANGDIIVADSTQNDSFNGGQGGVIKVNPLTGDQTLISSEGSFVAPVGIAIDNNGDFIVADFDAFGGSGGIIRVNPITGDQTTISSGGSFVDPYGIAIDGSGDFIIADPEAFGGSGGIIRVNPITGDQTTISSGGSFINPAGLAIDINGDIIVADNSGSLGTGSVIRVDPLTGVQTTISTGGTLVDPIGVALVPINNENNPPVATNDSYRVAQDITLTVNTTNGVLANDTDVEGDPLSTALVTEPSNGTLAFQPDGSFTYTPNTGFRGTDSFTYEASDGTATSNIATVTISINQLPTPTSDSYSVDEDNTLTVNTDNGVLVNDTDPDSDPLTTSLVTGPANGDLTLNPDGSFTYTPNGDFFGSDSFTYQANDNYDGTATATVNLTVNPIDDPPVAVNDSFIIDEDGTLNGNVLSNDLDVDGDPLTANLESSTTNGTLDFNANGSFTYTPDPDFFGSDSLMKIGTRA